jgi:hypothetical protein
VSEAEISNEINRRRTFAIISHPDAGKTTLTEKLLLFGGAIQMAGTVKGRKATRHATSSWMRLEQQRGISVTSSVMPAPCRHDVGAAIETSFSDRRHRVRALWRSDEDHRIEDKLTVRKILAHVESATSPPGQLRRRAVTRAARPICSGHSPHPTLTSHPLGCFAERFALMVSRISSKNVFTFLADGLIRSLPPYLRTFCPRKSKPSERYVILVFSCES